MRTNGSRRRALSALLACVLLTGQLLATAAVPAVACDRSLNADVLAHLGGSGMRRVVVDGTHAYAATNGGLAVFDISAPASAKVVAQVAMPGKAEDVAVADGFAYVVGDWGELRIVDVHDPAAPVARGRIGWGGEMYAVAVSGDRAYVTSDGHGFKVVDVSEKDDPSLVSYVSPPSGSEYRDIALSGSRAYVSYGASAESVKKIRAFDVSDPDATPVKTGNDYALSGLGVSIRSLAASGSLVCAAEAGRGLEIVDFSAATPVKRGTFSVAGAGSFDVAVAGDFAYAASGEAGLAVVDLSDPSAPAPKGSLGGTYEGVAVSGGVACLVAERALTVADISDPSMPGVSGVAGLVPGDAKDVAFADGYQYVAAGADGLLKVELAPGGAHIVGRYPLSEALKVVVAQGKAYVADGANLRVLDVSGTGDPVFLSGQPFSARPQGMCVDGSRLYVAEGEAGLAVYSLADPANPVLLGTYDDPESPIHAVAASAERVFVGIDGGSVLSLDADDPSAITVLSGVDTYGDVMSLSLDGDRLYAGTAIPDRGERESGKVYAIDASDRDDVFELSHYWLDATVAPVKAAGAYAYAGTDAGFYLVDFSDAGAPYVATTFGEGSAAIGGIDVGGDAVHLAAGDAGYYALRVPVLRTSGPSRYSTAVELSKSNWPNSSYVVLATGSNFADAACAAPLAHAAGGPLLLVHPLGITEDVLAEISRLAEGAGGIGSMHVVIIGSDKAVPASVESALAGIGVTEGNIERLAGWNRFDTARLVAHEFKQFHGSDPATAFIATGDDFPDALSVSGVAAALDSPVLLTKRSYVPTPTLAAIEDLGHPALVAVGSDKVLSDEVYAQLGCVDRLEGATRYETAKEVADYGLAHGFDADEIIVTSGRNFPDALVSGVVSARHGSPILLTSDALPDASAEFIGEHREEIRDVTVVGSSRAVSQDVEDQIVDRLTGQ